MIRNTNYREYVVIEILNPRRTGLNKYEYIPSCWIKKKNISNNNAVVGYPAENKINVLLKIMEKQTLDNKWPLLRTKIIYQTDSQADALRFILKMNETNSQNNKNDQSKKKPKKLEPKETRKISSVSKKTTTAISSKKKIKKTVKHLQYESKKIPPNHIPYEVSNIINKVDEISEVVKSQMLETIEILRRNLYNNENQSTSIHQAFNNLCSTLTSTNNNENYPVKVSKNIKGTNNERPKRSVRNRTSSMYTDYIIYSDDSSDSEESDCSEYKCPLYISNKINLSSPKQMVSEISTESSTSVKPAEFAVFTTDELNCNKNNQLSREDIYINFDKSWSTANESFQELFSYLDKSCTTSRQVMSSSEDENVSSLSQIRQLNENNQKMDNIKQQSLSQQPLQLSQSADSSVSSCTSGMSNNKLDSKWTLRYHNPRPGLIELMPNTGIYVRENYLLQCQGKFQDAKRLARALMTEVFSDEALEKCSYTGSKPKVSKDRQIPTKPGLDLHGRNTLIAYIEHYSDQRGWLKMDSNLIVTTLKNKIHARRFRK